jgi:hypothetical protein
MSLDTLFADAKAVWNFDNVWLDAKGNHDIANTGATFDSVIRKLGPYSGNWDGLNDFGAIANHADFNQDEFALAGWGYVPDLVGSYCGFLKHNQVTFTGWFLLVSAGTVFFRAADGASFPAYDTSYALGAPGWHFFVINHSLTVHKLYVDRVLRGSVAGGALAHNTHDVWIGRNPGPGFEGVYYNGNFDAKSYYTRVLTDGGVSVGQAATGEIAELYNGGTGVQLGADNVNSKSMLLNRRRRIWP